jgi:hypothetical protein
MAAEFFAGDGYRLFVLVVLVLAGWILQEL